MSGARMPMRCVITSMVCTLYVSDDRRETSDGIVTASAWRKERASVFVNRSPRRRSVTSRPMRDALRLANTLPRYAATETPTMATPHHTNAATLRVGATVSIIYARMRGRTSSASVPAVFMARPPVSRHLYSPIYPKMRFISPPGIRGPPFLPVRQAGT